jgi:putative endonuclease
VPRRGPSTTSRGALAEGLAVRYLTDAGYRLVARNVRCRGGELDIVAWDGEVLCFVEVRSLARTDHGDPLETITPLKIRRIVRAARDYISTLPHPWPVMRFDAVGIVMAEPPRIQLVREAFAA